MGIRGDSARSQVAQVRVIFSEFKGRRPDRVRIPATLCKLAVEAVNSGISVREVASAAGVSVSAVHAWRKASLPSARELTLVPDPAATPLPSMNHCARMAFGAIVIELPVAAITSSLLREIAAAMP